MSRLLFTVVMFMVIAHVNAQTPQEAQPCIPRPDANIDFNLPDTNDLTQIAGSIRDTLNKGGTFDTLEDTLTEAGLIIPAQENAPVRQIGGLWEADVNGDTFNDVVLNITEPMSEQATELTSAIIVYVCSDGQLTLNTVYEKQMFNVPIYGGISVRYLEDLTTDNARDIVFNTTECGAHTCFNRVNVLTWAGERVDAIFAEPISFPYGDYTVSDTDDDDSSELIITTGMIGSAGAGMQREHTLTYDWNGETLVLVSDEVAPPIYRFQALQDAVTAHSQGDYEEALRRYERALNDDSLELFTLFEGQQDSAFVILSSMAKFGIYSASVALYGVDDARTQNAYTTLQQMPDTVDTNYDDEQEPNVWKRYGEILHSELISGANLTEACATSADQIREMINLDNQLWTVAGYYPDLGYANPPPEPESLCN